MHGGTHHHIQFRLLNMNTAGVDRAHRCLVDVHTVYMETSVSQQARGGQADIAEADDADGGCLFFVRSGDAGIALFDLCNCFHIP